MNAEHLVTQIADRLFATTAEVHSETQGIVIADAERRGGDKPILRACLTLISAKHTPRDGDSYDGHDGQWELEIDCATGTFISYYHDDADLVRNVTDRILRTLKRLLTRENAS